MNLFIRNVVQFSTLHKEHKPLWPESLISYPEAVIMTWQYLDLNVTAADPPSIGRGELIRI